MLPASILKEIKENLLFVLDDVVKSRQYLNKHFQNSMNNYFLENYATLQCLKLSYNTQSGRQVRKEIYEKYTALQAARTIPQETLKCFLIMRGFVEEHRLNESLQLYRETLAAMALAQAPETFRQGGAEWISHQWRRLFALMVLHHTYYTNIQGVYELWYHVFDDRLIARERQKKRKEETAMKTQPAPYLKSISTKSEEEDFLTSQTSVSSLDQVKSEQSPRYQINNPAEYTNTNEQDDIEPQIVKKRATIDTVVVVKDHNNMGQQFGSVLSNPTSASTMSFQSEEHIASAQTSMNFFPFRLCEPQFLQQKDSRPQQLYHQPQLHYGNSITSDLPEEHYQYQQAQKGYQQPNYDFHYQKEAEEKLHFASRQNSYFQHIQNQHQHHEAQQNQLSYRPNPQQYQYFHQNQQYHQPIYPAQQHHNINSQQPTYMVSFYPQSQYPIDEAGYEEQIDGTSQVNQGIPEPLFSKPQTISTERFSDIGYTRPSGTLFGAPLFQQTSRATYNHNYYYPDVQHDLYPDLKSEDI